MIGNDAFQEVDITGITIPITKHNYLVQDRRRAAARACEEAFYLAGSGRPGPVLIDVPRDVQQEEFSLGEARLPPAGRLQPHGERAPRADQAGGRPAEGRPQRPLIIAGGGVYPAGAVQALRLLAEKAEIPVVYTLMGKGAFPNSHPLCLGLLGYHGRVAANTAVTGGRRDPGGGDALRRPLHRPAGHLRPPGQDHPHRHRPGGDQQERPGSRCPSWGTPRSILAELVELLPRGQARRVAGHAGWRELLRAAEAATRPGRALAGVTIPNVLRLLKRTRDRIRCSSPTWAATRSSPPTTSRWIRQALLPHLRRAGHHGLRPAGGHRGQGSAIPDRPVVAVCGDGSFLMTCQELAAAVAEKIPVVALVMNDYCLGMVHQLQHAFYGKRYQACRFGRTWTSPAWRRAWGRSGSRSPRRGRSRPALERGLEASAAGGRPCVVECVLEEPANVYPMVTGSACWNTWSRRSACGTPSPSCATTPRG